MANKFPLITVSSLIEDDSDSLRALVKMLYNESEEEIVGLNIPTGVP